MEMNEPVAWNYNDNNLEPNTITFNNVNSDWVMQITADRKIIVNEDVEISEAAQTVLDAMQPLLLKANPVKELTDEEIKEAKRDALKEYYSVLSYQDEFELSWIDELFARAILRKAQEK
jgi:hypothetical protein